MNKGTSRSGATHNSTARRIETDNRVLKVLKKQGHLTMVDISRAAEMPEPTVWLSVHRLLEVGRIKCIENEVKYKSRRGANAKVFCIGDVPFNLENPCGPNFPDVGVFSVAAGFVRAPRGKRGKIHYMGHDKDMDDDE